MPPGANNAQWTLDASAAGVGMAMDGTEKLEDNVPIGRVLRAGAYAAIVIVLVVFGMGAMLRAYSELRPGGKVWIRPDDWVWPLIGLSLASGLVVGALVIGWRLMNRRQNDPRWGMALLLIAILLFAAIVWPTPWAYREYDCAIVQVNRITGQEGLRVPTTLCSEPRVEAERDRATPAPSSPAAPAPGPPTRGTGQPTR